MKQRILPSSFMRGLMTAAVGLSVILSPFSAAAQVDAFKDPIVRSGGSSVVSGPDLRPVNAAVQAGNVTVGATAYVVALFKNTGTSAVKVSGINLYPSSTVSSTVSLNKCAEAPLPPEAECAITVAVTALQVGAWRVEVLLDHDGRTRLATASLSGGTEATQSTVEEVVKNDLEALPALVDFGTSTGGMTMVKSVVFRNRTSEDLTVSAIRFDAPPQAGFSYKSECPDKIKPGATCNVAVSWSPLNRGKAQAILGLVHSGKSGLTLVDVAGDFTPTAAAAATMYPEAIPDMGLLVTDREDIDFGTSVNGASAMTVSLVNAGSEPLTLKSIRLSGSDSGLSIARMGCKAGTVLSPVDACALTVNWLPSRAGAVIDDLQILHTGTRGVLVLPIRGTATAAVSRETLALRQNVSDENGGPSVAVTPVLDGYVVTSHSPTRAVINGPVGSIVVRDGEDVIVSGVKWTVTIVSTGVILSSEMDEIMLVFDKSLKASGVSMGSDSTSSSTSGANSSTSSSTSNSSNSSSNNN